jgi:hypothetical protein
MGRRLDALAYRLDRLAEPSLWQSSLFDRRTEQRAHVRRRNIANLQRHLRHRAQSIGLLGQVTTLEPQLIAAWLE